METIIYLIELPLNPMFWVYTVFGIWALESLLMIPVVIKHIFFN